MPAAILYTPAKGHAEGELELASGSGARADLDRFTFQLLDAAMPEGEWRQSAFSIDWSGLELAGRVYGQAWLERSGTTVTFLRFQLIDSEGRIIATGGATAHAQTTG